MQNLYKLIILILINIKNNSTRLPLKLDIDFRNQKKNDPNSNDKSNFIKIRVSSYKYL